MTKILIADDHHVVRRGVRGMLETHPGWEIVAEASDGYEALEAAIQTTPDIAILDCTLPRMNGLELTRRIHQQLPKTEILMFTFHEEESIIADALRAGARGFLVKSDTEKELVAAVEALSRHHPYFSWRVSEALLESYVKFIGGSSARELLTPREREVVQLVAEGLSNKQICRRLHLSIKTVETHRAAAMRKAGLSSTADLVRFAVRNHLVQA